MFPLSQSQYHSFPIHTTPFVAITIPLFPHSYHSLCCNHNTTLSPFIPLLLRGTYCSICSFLCSILYIVICLFVPLLLAFVLSVLLRFTALDYPFGVFKPFLFTIQTLQHRIQLDDYWVQEVDNTNLTTPSKTWWLLGTRSGQYIPYNTVDNLMTTGYKKWIIQTLQHCRQLDDYWVQEVDNINLTTP